jgi:hypothetical protein
MTDLNARAGEVAASHVGMGRELLGAFAFVGAADEGATIFPAA